MIYIVCDMNKYYELYEAIKQDMKERIGNER